MRITFAPPGWRMTGGIRSVCECATDLVDIGHSVTVIIPDQCGRPTDPGREPWMTLRR